MGSTSPFSGPRSAPGVILDKLFKLTVLTGLMSLTQVKIDALNSSSKTYDDGCSFFLIEWTETVQ